ncbi:MAG TPA: glycogen synthase [Acidimicrobiia bacterium]|nr:glycogen synthase [Acidimicrobiia bacterium]
MRILFVAAEVAPFSKTGGLADVADALPEALAAIGHEPMVVSPLYSGIHGGNHKLHRVFESVPITLLGGEPFDAYLAEDGRNWFVDYPRYYDREGIYRNDGDEHLRFLFLTHAALELCRRRSWSPEIAHANDWHTGLLPLFLRSTYGSDPILAQTRSIFTIHNLAYQGIFGDDIAGELRLGTHSYLLHQDHLREGRLSFMEHALMYADAITTVSPTYAREIQTPEYGVGLDGVLRYRSSDLYGILNGIDTTVWNPRTDVRIPVNYSETSLEAKAANRAALLARAGVVGGLNQMTVGIVSRLTGQKGIELMIRPLARRLESGHINFVALGSGENRYEQALTWLASTFSSSAHFQQGYDEDMAHLIEAGADVFLMPSRYEPSGLNQMYSLAYGTPPIVRRTGGLADSVTHYDSGSGEGTGFVFDHYTEVGLAWALDQALAIYPNREQWERLQRNGMSEDNSWERRAGEYDHLYRKVIAS